MALQMTGKIEVIGATTPISSRDGTKTYYKRELVLDCTRYDPNTGEPWENFPKFEFGGQKCNLLDNFQVGQRVTVDFSLRGARYQDQQTGETKYFTSIGAYKIELAQQAQQASAQGNPFPATAPTGVQPAQSFPPQVDAEGQPVGNADDLPF